VSEKRLNVLYYCMGAFSSSLLLLGSLFLFCDIEINERIFNSFSRFIVATTGERSFSKLRPNRLRIRPSSLVLKELELKGASFDNTRNLISKEVGLHNSFVVKPDPKRVYRLRPNISLEGYFLLSNKSMSFDGPLLYLDGSKIYSKAVQNYLKSEAFGKFEVHSDERGYRKTVPKVSHPLKTLIVGDSVAFGLGVNDDQTLASHLQRLLGNETEVINAGLSGYDTKSNREVIIDHRDKGVSHLVYIICQNDLEAIEGSNNIEKIKKIANEIMQYRNSFKRVSIVFHQYLYEVNPALFKPGQYEKVVRFNEALKSLEAHYEAKDSVQFYNWYNLVGDFNLEKGTSFASFALYSDHCHFSSLGNLVLAQALAKSYLDKP
jgi:hypothetical protein